MGHLGHGGEYHLGALLHRLLQKALHLLGGVALIVAAEGDLIAHDGFQVFLSLFVAQAPAAGRWSEGMDKGHIHMVRQGEKAQEAGLGVLHLGFHLHRRFRNADNVLPKGGHGFFQLRSGQVAQILKGIELQPQQQGLLRQDIQLPGIHRRQSLPEILIAGVKGAPLLLGPFYIRLLAQQGQELSVILGPAELDGVDARYLEEVQKLIIGLDSGLLGLHRQHPLDHRGNPGRAKIAQHAHPLVALLDIEIAQVFIAGNGVPDALGPQVGITKSNPFGCEFRFHIQQRIEAGGKGRNASGGFCAHNPLRGNLHGSHIHNGLRIDFRQQLIQHFRVRISPGGQELFEFPLPQLQCLEIFLPASLN